MYIYIYLFIYIHIYIYIYMKKNYPTSIFLVIAFLILSIFLKCLVDLVETVFYTLEDVFLQNGVRI